MEEGRRSPLLGAVIGDVVGSVYEFHNTKRKDFGLFSRRSRPTDDSVMSVAVADAILRWDEEGRPGKERLGELAAKCMRTWGRRFPNAGYGGHFRLWLQREDEGPYNSWGNGSAMRTSAVAMAARSEEECEEMASVIASVTHNHPEGIKGAVSVSLVTYDLLHGKTKEEAGRHAESFYNLDFSLESIRPFYDFDVSCQGSVPQAIKAFLEGEDYIGVLREGISLGGDSDTIGAISGSMAAALYPIPRWMEEELILHVDPRLLKTIGEFEERFGF